MFVELQSQVISSTKIVFLDLCDIEYKKNSSFINIWFQVSSWEVSKFQIGEVWS